MGTFTNDDDFRMTCASDSVVKLYRSCQVAADYLNYFKTHIVSALTILNKKLNNIVRAVY